MYRPGKGRQEGKGKEELPTLLNKEEVNRILNLTENDIKLFIEKAQYCAEEFKQGRVKTSQSQLRNFYDYVKNIEKRSEKDNFDIIKLHLLRPKIAYAVGRGAVSESFQKTFEDLINGIKTKKEFDNFVKFFEAIVAYYKE